ncbi:MAG: ABC transporter permease [Actinobacteria bacterium]|nr:ABC transporter permease [Actinomycetota bacterium]
MVEGLGRIQVGLTSRERLPSERGSLARHLLLLPSLLWFVAFFLVPLVLVAVHSLGQVSLVTFQMRFGWTLQNYRDIGDPLYLHTLVRSLVLAVSTTLLCALIGFPLAYFASRQPERWQRLLLLLVIVPFWTSFVVRTYSLVYLLQNGGPIDAFARRLGLVSKHLDFLYTPGSIGVGMVYSYLPLMILPIYVALDRVGRSVLEAASDMGASSASTFRRVVLPLAMPGLVAGATIVGISATGEYVIPEILGGGKTLMLGNIVADQFLNVGNYPFGSAIAMALLGVLAIALVGAGRARRSGEATA